MREQIEINNNFADLIPAELSEELSKIEVTKNKIWITNITPSNFFNMFPDASMVSQQDFRWEASFNSFYSNSHKLNGVRICGDAFNATVGIFVDEPIISDFHRK